MVPYVRMSYTDHSSSSKGCCYTGTLQIIKVWLEFCLVRGIFCIIARCTKIPTWKRSFGVFCGMTNHHAQYRKQEVYVLGGGGRWEKWREDMHQGLEISLRLARFLLHVLYSKQLNDRATLVPLRPCIVTPFRLHGRCGWPMDGGSAEPARPGGGGKRSQRKGESRQECISHDS